MTAVASEIQMLRDPTVHRLPPSFIYRFLTACDRERMFHTLVRHIPGATFQFFHRDDGTEGFHYVCPRAVLLFGSFRNWRRGRYVHPDDRQRLVDSVEQAIRTFSSWSFEGRYVLKSGEARWFQGMADPIHRADEIIFNGVILDIHARKCAEAERNRAIERERMAREEAEKANRAKERFLAYVSHELRAPLTPILLTAGLLEQDESLSPEIRADLRLIRENAELENRLVADLVDCASIRAGKLSVSRHRVSVHKALESALSTCRPPAERKHLRLQINLEARRDVLLGDHDRLCQIFWNILLNAVKFTNEGGTIRVHTADHEDGIHVEIADSGIGIDPQTLARAFEPFEQGPQMPNHKRSGLGLGLSIAQALVKAHHGTLSAASEGPGKGATFTVRLPVLK